MTKGFQQYNFLNFDITLKFCLLHDSRFIEYIFAACKTFTEFEYVQSRNQQSHKNFSFSFSTQVFISSFEVFISTFSVFMSISHTEGQKVLAGLRILLSMFTKM